MSTLCNRRYLYEFQHKLGQFCLNIENWHVFQRNSVNEVEETGSFLIASMRLRFVRFGFPGLSCKSSLKQRNLCFPFYSLCEIRKNECRRKKKKLGEISWRTPKNIQKNKWIPEWLKCLCCQPISWYSSMLQLYHDIRPFHVENSSSSSQACQRPNGIKWAIVFHHPGSRNY